ncbi:MAG: 4-(cytidine 5'-diphospho)-2-C-methyl-D-erythritol kinase [Peptococcaceae bacterium]
MNEAIIKAYAKINLLLDVLAKRDDGYHEVAMIMQAVSLHDNIYLKSAENISVRCNHPLVPQNADNLAFKAAELIISRYPVIPGLDIYIEKKIPVEAGLAGGSSNAAAVILGMNEMFSLGITEQEMAEIGAELGSDVPFCLAGPTAAAGGRGEQLTKLPDFPSLWLVLVKPEFGVKTKNVYHNLNIERIKNHPDINAYIAALHQKNLHFLLAKMGNVLEFSTFQLYPEVEVLSKSLRSLGAKHVLMSGSGPTVFALFAERGEAEIFAQKAQNFYKEVYIAHTLKTIDMKERVKLR